MLKTLCLLTCFCAFSQEKSFENKIITTIRHGIEKNLEYIDKNYAKVGADCLLGIALSTAIIKDAYQNGTHIMDNSSLKLMSKSVNILKKGIPAVEKSKLWMTKYILDYNIWENNIEYKYNKLDSFSEEPSLQILENIFRDQNFSNDHPNTDFCLQDIVNGTISLKPRKCFINKYCWKKYYVYDKMAFGYPLTHRLLLLQLAKGRKCIINQIKYEAKVKQLCQSMFAEVFAGDYFDVLDDMFDLFLEEIVMCGYEGYTEFFSRKWLFYIFKSQRSSGCFPATLGDKSKTRIKRNTNVFEDGCADHTTGLGTAVLSLYYNFIIKENVDVLE